MNEIWKDIPGCEGRYWVSNLGRIKSINKILTPDKSQKGYLRARIAVGGKQKSLKIHRLVAMLFIPNPDNLPQVNHKNEDKADNRVCNLEWVDNRTNYCLNTNKAHGCIKVVMIDSGKETVFESVKQAARTVGISRYSITAACRGTQKVAGGKKWRFA